MSRSLLQEFAPGTVEHLHAIFQPNPGRLNLTLQIAKDTVAVDRLRNLEDFFLQEGFARFVRRRLNISEMRYTNTLSMLLRRVNLEIDARRLGEVAGSMSSKLFREQERALFRPPADMDFYQIFERGYIALGEQNPDLLEPYVYLFSAPQFQSLKEMLLSRDSDLSGLFQSVFGRILDHLLGKKSLDATIEVCRLMTLPEVRMYLDLSGEYVVAGQDDSLSDNSSITITRDLEFFLSTMFQVFHDHADPKLFVRAMKTLKARYANRPAEAYRNWKRFLNIIYNLRTEDLAVFREFFREYGKSKDSVQRYMRDAIVELGPEEAIAGMSVLISPPLLAVRNAYDSEPGILKLFVKKILTAELGREITGMHPALHSVVLKLMFSLKLNRDFLTRRGRFFEYLNQKTGSNRLEMEVVRMLFFEYIFIATKKVAIEPGMHMTVYCDELHRKFCALLDAFAGDSWKLRQKKMKQEDIFPLLLKLLRDHYLEEYSRKFPDAGHQLRELQAAAESTQLEDLLYDALNELDPEDLDPYHAHAIGAYRRDPERLPETLRSDYWYRYTFFMASTHIRSGIMHLVGYVPVFPDQDLNAYTDGHSIHLPEYINDFKDPLDKEEDNRNLTLYIGLALHEAGHIVAGSFRFDLSYYLTRLEDPGLFRMIHNIIEDYRIEEFLMRIEAHPQVNRILPAMNEFYALQILSESAGFAFQVMAEMALRARKLSGRWQEHPAYARMLEKIKRRDYNTGRFRSIPDMVEYAVHRLQCMDVGNPLIAYPLSRELYEVMKHWPREARQEIYEVRLIPTGLHSNGGIGTSGESRGDSAGKPPVRPLSREELESLYNAYDEDPEGFLRRHDLPVYPQLLPDKSSQEQTVGQTTGQATGTDPENAWNPIQGTTQPQAQERNTAGNQSADNLLRQLTEIDRQPNYEDAGTIDFSRRTRADDLIAEKQKEPSSFLDDWNPFKLRKDKKSQRQNSKHENSKTKNNKDKEYKTKNIYSIDPATGSRTKLSEVRVYDVDRVDPVYMQMFRRWSGLEKKIQKLLSELLPQVNDELEHSAFEGDLNMELLHEILSDKNRTGVQEYLDIYREQRKSAEIVIGLDISGSTGILPPEAFKYPVMATEDHDGQTLSIIDVPAEARVNMITILDIEKAFAMLLARALQYLTPRVEVMGFNSVTSTNVYRAKSIQAISGFSPDHSNRDGDFIRYVNDRLSRSKADVRYFFLISDGQPNADNYSGKEALDDTLMAMREAKRAGVNLIYFNIDKYKKKYFHTFAPEALFARHFSDPEDLPAVIPEMVQRVTASMI